MLRTLFNQGYDNKNAGILLIDNIEMHIYFKRHMKLIEKLEEHFPDRQIIATTHSPVITSEMDEKYLCDLEDFIGRGEIEECRSGNTPDAFAEMKKHYKKELEDDIRETYGDDNE